MNKQVTMTKGESVYVFQFEEDFSCFVTKLDGEVDSPYRTEIEPTTAIKLITKLTRDGYASVIKNY